MSNVSVNWFEIPVSDVSKAAAFYGAVLGNDLGEMPGPDGVAMRVFMGAEGPCGALNSGSGKPGANRRSDRSSCRCRRQGHLQEDSDRALRLHGSTARHRWQHRGIAYANRINLGNGAHRGWPRCASCGSQQAVRVLRMLKTNASASTTKPPSIPFAHFTLASINSNAPSRKTRTFSVRASDIARTRRAPLLTVISGRLGCCHRALLVIELLRPSNRVNQRHNDRCTNDQTGQCHQA